MSRRSIRTRKRRRKIQSEFELQLTSMMDMLIILIVFMLKSYQSNAVAYVTSNSIKLPLSLSKEAPGDSVNVIIDAVGITVEGEKVLSFKGAPTDPKAPTPPIEGATYEFEEFQVSDGGRKILPLFDHLVRYRDNFEVLKAKVQWQKPDGSKSEPPKFNGSITIHADKSIRYDILKKVMYTGGAAQYKTFRLITLRKDST